MKNKTTAILLAFFLGSIGIHQFYLGNNTKGVLYLLFFWTLIPSILALIDFITLIIMTDDDFNKKYNLTAGPQVVVNNHNSGIHYTEELLKLKELRDKGIISEEEFAQKKAKIMN